MKAVWVCQYGLKPKSPNCVVEPKDCGAYDNGVCALTGGSCDATRFVEERIGRWIHDSKHQCFKCSVCGHKEEWEHPYCNCGARMEVLK